MGLTNFTKNTIQDLFWRGQDADIAGESLTWSDAPVFYLGLIGGAAFPNQGAALRSTAYSAGEYAWPKTPNGRLYKCATAGTTGAAEPVWPVTDGGTVADGTVIWTEQTSALAAGVIPEPCAADYVRQPWLCSLGTVMGCNLSASSAKSAGSSGTIANLNLIQFPLACADEWGPIWGICFFDAEMGGNPLHFYSMTVPKVVGINDQMAFSGGMPNAAYGAIQITMG
jgi:hypothetical protein